MDAHARKMIYIPKKNNTEHIVYVFLHGAFCSPWSWSYIVDELCDKKGYMCVLFYLKDHEKIANIISEFIPSTYTIRLVGFSLGSLVALSINKIILKTHKTELFLISTPIMSSLTLVRFRIQIARFLNCIFCKINRRFFPLFLRGKLKTDESIFLLNLIQLDYRELVQGAKGSIQVNIYSGKLDYISGSIKTQQKLSELFCKHGVKSTFTCAGFTGHFPYLVNRKNLVEWLLI